jgi:hypothetical protein
MIGVRGALGIVMQGMGTGVEEEGQGEEEEEEEDTAIAGIAGIERQGGMIAHPHLSRRISNSNSNTASVVVARRPTHRIMAAMIVADDNPNPNPQLESGSLGRHHCPEQVSRAKTSSDVISRSAVRKMVARRIWRWTKVTMRGVSPARGTELKAHPLVYPPNPLRSRKRYPLQPTNRPIHSTRHRPAHSPAHVSRNPVESVDPVDPVESVELGDRRDYPVQL